MLSVYFQKKILSLYKNDYSVKGIHRITGHSRNTIRKIIKNKKPFTFKSTPRLSRLDKHKNIIIDRFSKEELSRKQIFYIITEQGYDGSFSTLSNFITKLKREKDAQCKKTKKNGRKRNEDHIEWIINLLQGKISNNELETQFSGITDVETIQKLNLYIHSKPLSNRNRATTIFANFRQIPIVSIDRQYLRMPKKHHS